MKMLTGESILIGNESGGSLVVTTHRLRLRSKQRGSSQVQGLFLEDLTFFGFQARSNPTLLWLAGLAVAVGITGMSVGLNQPGLSSITWLSFLMALVLVIAYFASRQQVLSFSTPGGSIVFKAEPGEVRGILEAVEGAKHARMLARVATASGSATEHSVHAREHLPLSA